MELFRKLGDKKTYRQTDGLTEVFLEALSQLKIIFYKL